jgi:plastocyanin
MKPSSHLPKAAVKLLIAAAFASSALLLQAGAGPEAFAAPAIHTVVIADMKFVPETLRVRPGDTIVWVNKDFFPHTATAQDRRFDSHDIATNQSWKYVATKTGTVPYVCTLHPTMKATLIVK